VAIAAVTTLGYLGSFTGPPLIGALTELTGLSTALALLIAAAVVRSCSPAAPCPGRSAPAVGAGIDHAVSAGDRPRELGVSNPCIAKGEGGVAGSAKIIRAAPRRKDGDDVELGQEPLQRSYGRTEIAVGG
jgi:hypothetical protein